MSKLKRKCWVLKEGMKHSRMDRGQKAFLLVPKVPKSLPGTFKAFTLGRRRRKLWSHGADPSPRREKAEQQQEGSLVSGYTFSAYGSWLCS